MSANAWRNTSQQCKRCHINVQPYKLQCLESSAALNKSDAKKPHPQELCEKCKRLGRYCGSNATCNIVIIKTCH